MTPSSEKFQVRNVVEIQNGEDLRLVLVAAAQKGWLACYNPTSGRPLDPQKLKFSQCDPWLVMVVVGGGEGVDFVTVKRLSPSHTIRPRSEVSDMALRAFLGTPFFSEKKSSQRNNNRVMHMRRIGGAKRPAARV